MRVSLAPSIAATLLIASFGCATCVLVAMLPLASHIAAPVLAVVVAWAVDRILVIGLRRGRRAVRALELRGDLTLVVRNGDGSVCAGRVHRDTYVGARLSTIVWRPFGRWRVRTILLLPDMLSARDFRRLRVLLRYGRSDVAQGEPSSHA